MVDYGRGRRCLFACLPTYSRRRHEAQGLALGGACVPKAFVGDTARVRSRNLEATDLQHNTRYALGDEAGPASSGRPSQHLWIHVDFLSSSRIEQERRRRSSSNLQGGGRQIKMSVVKEKSAKQRHFGYAAGEGGGSPPKRHNAC
eukprot:scaffold620_cov282-Pinguiococcus_pyrenoidosus.AAC.14